MPDKAVRLPWLAIAAAVTAPAATVSVIVGAVPVTPVTVKVSPFVQPVPPDTYCAVVNCIAATVAVACVPPAGGAAIVMVGTLVYAPPVTLPNKLAAIDATPAVCAPIAPVVIKPAE